MKINFYFFLTDLMSLSRAIGFLLLPVSQGYRNINDVDNTPYQPLSVMKDLMCDTHIKRWSNITIRHHYEFTYFNIIIKNEKLSWIRNKTKSDTYLPKLTCISCLHSVSNLHFTIMVYFGSKLTLCSFHE